MPEVTTPNAGLFADNRRLFAGGAGQIPFNQLDIARQEEGQRRYLEALGRTNRLADILNRRKTVTDRMGVVGETLKAAPVANRIDIGGSLAATGFPIVSDPRLEGAALRDILGGAIQKSGTGINQARQGGVGIPAADLNTLLGTHATNVEPTSITAARERNEGLKTTIKKGGAQGSRTGLGGLTTVTGGDSQAVAEAVNALTGTSTGLPDNSTISLNPAQENMIENLRREHADKLTGMKVTVEGTNSGLKVVQVLSPEGHPIYTGILEDSGQLRQIRRQLCLSL